MQLGDMGEDSQGLVSFIHVYKGVLTGLICEHLLWVNTAALISRRLQLETEF